jgi:hypothetical protein
MLQVFSFCCCKVLPKSLESPLPTTETDVEKTYIEATAAAAAAVWPSMQSLAAAADFFAPPHARPPPPD